MRHFLYHGTNGSHPLDPGAMTTPLLTIDNIAKSYGPIQALSGVSLSVEEGDLFGLLGPNGAWENHAAFDSVVPHGSRFWLGNAAGQASRSSRSRSATNDRIGTPGTGYLQRVDGPRESAFLRRTVWRSGSPNSASALTRRLTPSV